MDKPHVIISSEAYWQLDQWLRFKPGDFPIKDTSKVDRYVGAILNARRILGLPSHTPLSEITDANP